MLWTNEENGGRGGLAYRDAHRAELAKHVHDARVRRRRVPAARLRLHRQRRTRARRSAAIATLLAPVSAPTQIAAGGGGADIGPSVQEQGIPSLSLEVDGEYFLIHHTPADTVDQIDPAHLAKCAAAVAVMAYVVADLPHRLGE